MKKYLAILALLLSTLIYGQTTTTPVGSIKHNNELQLNNVADTLLVRNSKSKKIEGVTKLVLANQLKPIITNGLATTAELSTAINQIQLTPGPQGIQGVKGDQGVQGEKGLKGDNGFSGSDGAVGPQGPQGIQGETGLRGIQGETGPQGPIGFTGAKGADGTGVSIKGSFDNTSQLPASGANGDAYLISGNLHVWNGSAWKNVGSIQGPQGLIGLTGSQGLQGPQGLKGDKGDQGIQGAQGPQGVKGDTGTFVGSYTDLTNKPTIPTNNTQLSNGAGYITASEISGKVDKVTGKSLISDVEIARIATVTNQDISGKENAFSKNTAFNKNFGNASNTVAEGNDSRINNGQTAFSWGNHASAGYAKAVNTVVKGSGTGMATNDVFIGWDNIGDLLVQVDNTPLGKVAFKDWVFTETDKKVDKVTGKSLLSNSEVTRLATLVNYTHPANHPASMIVQDAGNRFVSDTEKSVWYAKQNAITNPITGLGATNYLAKFTGASSQKASVFLDNDNNGGIGTTLLPSKFNIKSDTSYGVAGTSYDFQIGDASQAGISAVNQGFYISQYQGPTSFGRFNLGVGDTGNHTFDLGINAGGSQQVQINRSGGISVGNTISLGLGTGNFSGNVRTIDAVNDKDATTLSQVKNLIPTAAINANSEKISFDNITSTRLANMSGTNTGDNAVNNLYSGLSAQISGKENAFSKNTAFNKNFGIASNTVAEGSDSRINNGQTAFTWGNHASAGYAASTHAHSFAQITNKPTTLAGYGITDGGTDISGKYDKSGGTISGAVLVTGVTTLQNTLSGTSSSFSGSVTASSGFFNSDIRLKNISKRDGDVAYYTWKDGRDSLEHTGYIAQEVKGSYPNQVKEDSKGMLSVNYVEVLVAKIRDLEKRIDELENKK